MMNKKGQTVFGSIFMFMAAGIFFIFFAEIIGYWGHDIVVTNGLTGFLAFLFDNINMWITMVFFIAFMVLNT